MSATSRDGMFAIVGSFMSLSTIAASLRFYARRYQKVPLGLDDWTALLGTVTYIAVAALAITMALWKENGYGTNTLTPEQKAARAKPTIQMSFAYDFLNLNTLACAKLSALFMYRRVFAVDRHGWFNRVILATVAIIAVWYITSDFLSLYQCPGHFSAAWDGHIKQYCILNPVWAKELAISDFILDVWVLVLPIPPIMRLHTTLAKKLGIFGVFLLAFIGLGASIARIVYFVQANGASREVVYIAMLESGISITVVNLPSIYYLCTSVIPNRVASSLRSARSIGSNDSRSCSHGDIHLECSQQDRVPVTAVAVQGKSSYSSQGSSFDGEGGQNDLEAARGHAHEMSEFEGGRQGNVADGIRVKSKIEVRGD